MDELTWVDYATVGIAVAAAAFAGVEAWNARGARRDAAAASNAAGEHEAAAVEASKAANAARVEASTALKEIAELMKSQADAQPAWVPKSRGGSHLMWDMVNRTGRRVVASLEFPDAGQANIMESEISLVFESYVNAGQGLGFRWERRGVPGSSSINVDVIWSAEDRSVMNKVERVRVYWPSN